eukprot:tig00021111_g18396.t1
MSVAVPLFTYAASVNHKADHTIKETVLGNQATETPYNATAVPFSEADLVRVGELRCDKMRTREGGSAVPGRVKTQRLTVTNGAWDGSGYSTNQLTFNGTGDGESNAALYVQGGGANVVGGLRVSGNTTLTGTVTTTGININNFPIRYFGPLFYNTGSNSVAYIRLYFSALDQYGKPPYLYGNFKVMGHGYSDPVSDWHVASQGFSQNGTGPQYATVASSQSAPPITWHAHDLVNKCVIFKVTFGALGNFVGNIWAETWMGDYTSMTLGPL